MGMGFSVHPHAHLVQSCISEGDRRISAVKKLIDRLTFFQAGKRSVLPEDRRHIRNGSEQTLMSASQRTMAKFQTLIQDLPELLHISLGRTSHVYKVDRHNALIKTTVELVASVRILL